MMSGIIIDVFKERSNLEGMRFISCLLIQGINKTKYVNIIYMYMYIWQTTTGPCLFEFLIRPKNPLKCTKLQKLDEDLPHPNSLSFKDIFNAFQLWVKNYPEIHHYITSSLHFAPYICYAKIHLCVDMREALLSGMQWQIFKKNEFLINYGAAVE